MLLTAGVTREGRLALAPGVSSEAVDTTPCILYHLVSTGRICCQELRASGQPVLVRGADGALRGGDSEYCCWHRRSSGLCRWLMTRRSLRSTGL